jgi:hypothetical protein
MIRSYRQIHEIYERRIMTITAIITILLKILGNPALIAGLIAYLQKLLHP